MPHSHRTDVRTDATPPDAREVRPKWPLGDARVEGVRATMSAHACGRWRRDARTSQGRAITWYSDARWDTGDPYASAEEALAQWRREAPYLLRGDPLPDGLEPDADCTLHAATTAYLLHQHARSEHGEITAGHVRNDRAKLRWFGGWLGWDRALSSLEPGVFTRALDAYYRSTDPPPSHSSRNALVRAVKAMLRWNHETRNTLPVRVPREFGLAPQRVMRLDRERTRDAPYTRAELHRIIASCPDTPSGALLRACTLLGINGGCESSYLARLRTDALRLDEGYVRQHRQKTGQERVIPLWPETVRALRAWLDVRPPVRGEHARLVFVTNRRTPINYEGGRHRCDALGSLYRDRRRAVGVRGGLKLLRSTCQTRAEAGADDEYTKLIMGHAIRGIRVHYVLVREYDRLLAITDSVRRWLLPWAPERGGFDYVRPTPWQAIFDAERAAVYDAADEQQRMGLPVGAR